ncbi:photosystem I reaction center subunit N, chloroplastic-like [Cornus florida]|uniref:photosystem I reaction center subunit N, chloroplastic-like n=1 Tax=Cornus florida TaxID=4283 RepID=UPI00289A7A08|nr:photosystem I reaction center subunit N, chloroplastic-like [Cornus florida]
MATMNSSVLACNYAISSGVGSPELNSKIVSSQSLVSSVKLPVINMPEFLIRKSQSAAALFTTAASTSSANAGVIEDYLEKSKANK